MIAGPSGLVTPVMQRIIGSIRANDLKPGLMKLLSLAFGVRRVREVDLLAALTLIDVGNGRRRYPVCRRPRGL